MQETEDQSEMRTQWKGVQVEGKAKNVVLEQGGLETLQQWPLLGGGDSSFLEQGIRAIGRYIVMHNMTHKAGCLRYFLSSS